MQINHAIEELEKKIGCKLPPDYRSFLMDNNQEEYSEKLFIVPSAAAAKKVLPVNLLYEAMCEPDEFSSVAQNYDIMAARNLGDGALPDNCIPIGDSIEDTEILLYVRGSRKGEVWIKDYSYLDEGKTDKLEQGMHHVSESFAKFLDSLYEDESSS